METLMIAHRQKNGGISNLSEISKIKGIGPKSYKQAAGFLRIDSKTLKNGNLENVNPLDNTWVHPEVYELGNWFQNFSRIYFELDFLLKPVCLPWLSSKIVSMAT